MGTRLRNCLQGVLRRLFLLSDRPAWRIGALSAAAALGVTGALFFATGSVVQANLLSSPFYERAFDENRAYDRIYEEILADPELAIEINRALDISDPQRSMAVSTLRSLFPPDELRGWTEDGIEALVEYLSGRRDDLEPAVDLGALPLNRSEATRVRVKTEVAEAPEVRLGSVAEVVTALVAARESIMAGKSVEVVPAGDVSSDALALFATAIMAPLNAESRTAIEDEVLAHLTSDDLRGALAVAAPYIAEFGLDPGGEIGQGGEGALASASARVNGWLQQLVDGVEPLRQVIRRYGPWLLPLAIVCLTLSWLLAGAAAGGDAFRRTAVASGVIILSAMAAALITWTVAPVAINSVLDDATGGSLVASAPESVHRLLDDIRDSAVGAIRATGTASMLWIGVAGLISTVIPAGIEIAQRRGRINVRHPLWVPVGAWALIIAATTWGPFGLRTTVEARSQPCNGHVELCGLRYDEVTFPGTHNSMSTSESRWIFPFHDAGIRTQLEEGVRVLLIDAHHWSGADAFVEELSLKGTLTPEAREFLSSMRGRFGDAPEGVFLCHVTCWLGAASLESTLEDIREFMEDRPREVVTVIIEDAVPPEEIVDVFEKVGLDEIAHIQEQGEEWPALGDMIDSGRRLVVFAEHGKGPADWFHNAWEHMWDTRYDFGSLSELDCELNRGSRDNPLFLVNHWIAKSVPDRADATRMNSVPRLLERVGECEATQGRKPNFIAVDFYRIGELMRAVDLMNGIGVR